MFASPAAFDPYTFAYVATGSPSPSTASSSSASTSPSLFDFPSPSGLPISTPSPSSPSSLVLPFYPDSHPGRSASYDSAVSSSDPSSSSSAVASGMTIDPSLLFGAELYNTSNDGFLSTSAPASSAAGPPPHSPTSRTSFFPASSSSSPSQPLPPPLFGESTTPQQRRAQIAALSSLVVVKAPSSAGPVKRGKGAAAARTRSLSQGRAAGVPSDRAHQQQQRGRRASAHDGALPAAAAAMVDSHPPGSKSAKSWLDALKEAEIKAKLRRLQTQAEFDAPPGAPGRGRMAALQSQLLAQSMAQQPGGLLAQCESPTATLGGSAFPWVR